MKKTVLLLALCVMLTGCMNIEQTLVINDDGSGTFEMYVAYDIAVMKQFEMMSQSMGDEGMADLNPFAMTFDKEDIKKELEQNSKGLKLIDFVTGEDEKNYYTRMKCSFDNIDKLPHLMETIEEDKSPEEGGDKSVDDRVFNQQLFVKQEDGTRLFSMNLNDMYDMGDDDPYNEYGDESYSDDAYYDDADYDDPTPPDDPETYDDSQDMSKESADQMIEGMMEMFPLMKEASMTFTVVLPGEIVESNANEVKGNKAVWIFNVENVNKRADKLHAICK